tara:strand:+ start:1643 stop:2182 length:540 start_codon:yes stop_codon:yes gene_type:complete
MKTIINNWNLFVILEQTGVEKLAADPKKTKNFADAVGEVSDPVQLKRILTALLNNPDVKEAAQLFIDLKSDIDKGEQPASENIVKDFGLGVDTLGQKAGAQASTLLQNKTAQNILKYGGPVVALGIIAATIAGGGSPSLGLVNALGRLAVSGQSTSQLVNGLEAALIASAGFIGEENEV